MYEQVVESIIEQIKKYPKIIIYNIKTETPKSDLVTDNIVEFRKSINLDKLNLILDIDGTILDSTLSQYIILRPYYQDLFEFCLNKQIPVYLWTCGEYEHAQRTIDAINGSKYITKVLCRGDSWYYNVYTVKKMKWLSKHLNNMLLVDNTISMSEGQPDNTLIIKTFGPINYWSGTVNENELSDEILIKLIDFLDRFIKSKQDLSDFIKYDLKPSYYILLKYYSIV